MLNILGFLAGGSRYPTVMHGGSEGFLGNVAWECQISWGWGTKFSVTPIFRQGELALSFIKRRVDLVLERMLGSHVVPG